MSAIWIGHKASAQSQLNLKCVRIEPGDRVVKSPSSQLRWDISKKFEINNDYNIRLRNQKGRLMPIDYNLRPNSKESPYLLEVFIPSARDQRILPSEKQHLDLDAKMERATTALAAKSVISNYRNRISELEEIFDSRGNGLMSEKFKQVSAPDLCQASLDCFLKSIFISVAIGNCGRAIGVHRKASGRYQIRQMVR